jgi:hypothetical protein
MKFAGPGMSGLWRLHMANQLKMAEQHAITRLAEHGRRPTSNRDRNAI